MADWKLLVKTVVLSKDDKTVAIVQNEIAFENKYNAEAAYDRIMDNQVKGIMEYSPCTSKTTAIKLY